jgi:restriction system protein
MTLWLVRAGKVGERENLALDNDLAVIGWEELPDLSPIRSREELTKLLIQTFPDDKLKTIKNREGQLWPFIREMKTGDLVALPLKSRSFIAIGQVTGEYQYRTDLTANTRHVRPVKWVKELPRAAFDQDLLYSLGAFMTVCRIERNNAEERVKALVSGKVLKEIPKGRKEIESGTEPEIPPDLEQYALDQIREFISRKFKGHRMTMLVAGILEAQGYQVRISPEGPDSGVDIMAGKGPLGFDAPRLVVQVKSGDSPVDVTILDALQGVIDKFNAQQGLLVAWGGYKSSVVREAPRQFFKIRLWDAEDLVRMLQTHYEELPDSIQAELPLKRIWTLVPSEEE